MTSSGTSNTKVPTNKEELNYNYAPSWVVSFMASTTSYLRPPPVAYHLVSVSSSFFFQILVVLPAHMKAL